MGLDGFDDFLVSGEAAEAGCDATVGYVVFYLGEEVMGDFGFGSKVWFECGRRHILNGLFLMWEFRHLPLQKLQEWGTQIQRLKTFNRLKPQNSKAHPGAETKSARARRLGGQSGHTSESD